MDIPYTNPMDPVGPWERPSQTATLFRITGHSPEEEVPAADPHDSGSWQSLLPGDETPSQRFTRIPWEIIIYNDPKIRVRDDYPYIPILFGWEWSTRFLSYSIPEVSGFLGIYILSQWLFAGSLNRW